MIDVCVWWCVLQREIDGYTKKTSALAIFVLTPLNTFQLPYPLLFWVFKNANSE